MSLHDELLDKMYKEELFKNIQEFSFQINQYTKLIEETYSFTNINTKLPNIATYLNNKLILDIFPKFQEANLLIESTGSIIGESIIFDLLGRTTNAIQALENYSCTLHVSNSKALTTTSPMKTFLSHLRTFFTGSIFTKEQLKKANMYLEEYKNNAKSIYNYSLDNDIGTSIIKYVEDNSFPQEIVLELLEDDLKPNMKKLNLSDSIPDLKEKLLSKSRINNNFIKEIKTSPTKIKNISNFNRNSSKEDLYK